MKPFLFSLLAFVLLSAFHTEPAKPRLPKEFRYIPAGKIYLDADGEEMKQVSAFYISKYEITNRQYRQFCQEVSTSLSEETRQNILPDAKGWKLVVPDSIDMTTYFNHTSFDDFPVVNITYEAAVAYCQWLEEKISAENPGYNIEVRLPTKEEWIWAAQGGRTQAMFPWGKYYLRNDKGEPLCNFKVVKDAAIYRDRKTGKAAIAERVYMPGDVTPYTANVHSFYPNDYSLYNMCGNVSEMISEKGIGIGGSWNDYGGDVHIRAETKYLSLSPTVGFRPIIVVKEK